MTEKTQDGKIYGNDLNNGRGFKSFQSAIDTIDYDQHERESLFRINWMIYRLFWKDTREYRFDQVTVDDTVREAVNKAVSDEVDDADGQGGKRGGVRA